MFWPLTRLAATSTALPMREQHHQNVANAQTVLAMFWAWKLSDGTLNTYTHTQTHEWLATSRLSRVLAIASNERQSLQHSWFRKHPNLLNSNKPFASVWSGVTTLVWSRLDIFVSSNLWYEVWFRCRCPTYCQLPRNCRFCSSSTPHAHLNPAAFKTSFKLFQYIEKLFQFIAIH